jgi:hypothetical protein
MKQPVIENPVAAFALPPQAPEAVAEAGGGAVRRGISGQWAGYGLRKGGGRILILCGVA